MISVLDNGSESGARVASALEAAGFDLGRAEAIRIFSDGSRAGDMATFFASCDGLLIVAAPGGPMHPAEQNPPSDLILYIRRAEPGLPKGELAPPDPLADPLVDINILPGQATSYEVKKGEYIQILDVQGRECSDFQAFSQTRAGQRAGARDRPNHNARADGQPLSATGYILEILEQRSRTPGRDRARHLRAA